ncbi:hypothetical protein GTA08_BOTSDO05432 [Neofusicoccum parvum]|uniref:Uncharacterized protein n=1 Tax=Botryosphaeria parva (strain UCR-NP2) TaxID=1287680 RepID=R1GM83_BOTPV|nr:hypothetical protein UCRNP2_6162 [Neofusicoccum parvum UCRNP2]GME50856.1 hypothetical protein GTA08_BOTSDO05432 [Neofusicoccum parvum]
MLQLAMGWLFSDWATYLIAHGSSPSLKPLFSLLEAAKTHLLPLIDHVSKNPDLASITLLVVVLLVSLKILNILYRAVMFWITLAFRLVFWGTVVVVGLFVWSRGVEGAVQDFLTWGRYWAGVWQSEYDRFQEQLEVARAYQQQQQAFAR